MRDRTAASCSLVEGRISFDRHAITPSGLTSVAPLGSTP
jgi:hypothetical protein